MNEYTVICENSEGKEWKFKVFAFDTNQAWRLGREKLYALQQREYDDTIAFQVIDRNGSVI